MFSRAARPTQQQQQQGDHEDPRPQVSSATKADATEDVEMAVDKLHELGINVVALDFDHTILNIHTWGRWQGTADELSRHHVRPELRRLMVECSQRPNIHMCIVTFTPQVGLVRHVVKDIVGPDRAPRIPVRCRDKSWTYDGKECSRLRKQPFIGSAVQELREQQERSVGSTAIGNADPRQPGAAAASTMEITRQSILLIDDDAKNVREAIRDGMRAIWLNPDNPYELFQNIVNLT